jgi:NAD(P)-dependent dehydrogenase (short-subunit alcohol dehydrogenase family)
MNDNKVATMSREPQLAGQTIVVLGGSSGMGFETAKQARSEGANVVLTGRNPQRVEHAARELGALSSAAFDVTDFDRLGRFLDELPKPIDHIMVTAGGPYYARLADIDFAAARRNVEEEFWLPLHLARFATGKVRPGGTLLFIGGIGGRRPSAGPVLTTFTAAIPALTRALAVELAPIRVNLIAPGFVDTPLSASILGDQLDARREQLRKTLPIGRVVGPADIAALAIHLMVNTAVTGVTYDIDGGQQLLEG